MINDSDIPDDMRHSKMVRLRICYFAGGIVGLYKQWFCGDLDCTLNDIAMGSQQVASVGSARFVR